MSYRLVILGAGGHARVVLDSLGKASGFVPHAVVDSNRLLWGSDLDGVPIRGGDELLPELIKEGVTHFVIGVGSIGNAGPRRRLFEIGVSSGLCPTSVMHPTAAYSTKAKIGAGALLLSRSVVNAGAILGKNVIVNTGAIVEHDCVLGDYVHIGPGATLGGGIHVGDGTHIGLGASVRQQIKIGPNSIVGVGAVVVDDVPRDVVVVGVPARISRQIHQGRSDIDVKRKRNIDGGELEP
jgi:sugar O-acyltransferase (sialic acid O-acetyltransferase NeuD family)